MSIEVPGDYPYLFSRVAGQLHWLSLQTKPSNMMGLLPRFGANKPAGWTYKQPQEKKGLQEQKTMI
jgi:hypothetical protein